MEEIAVIAHIYAREGKEAIVRQALEAMVAPTRRETGCRQYHLHTDLRDPTHFFFYEIWDSVEAHDAHMDSEHLAQFVVACKGAIAESNICHLSRLE